MSEEHRPGKSHVVGAGSKWWRDRGGEGLLLLIHPLAAGNPANDTQREDDIVVPEEDRLESYAGKNEDTQVEHRRKYKEFKRTVVSIYHPKSDDLLGGKPTINEACEALGY